MSKVVNFNAIEKAVRDASSAGSRTDGEQRLIFLIALQAYLDILWYKDHLRETLNGGIRRPAASEIERQYRYSLVFFLHPWGRSHQSYAAYLFSLIGKDCLLRRIQNAVRDLEAEIRDLKGERSKE